MKQQTELHEAICSILVRNNVRPNEAQAYLNPKIRELMPDPSTLLDMDKAVDRFIEALNKQEKIAIFADYDVDGASSAAQIIWWLRGIGLDCTLYVPDRINEGFGPNPIAMSSLANHHSLIICVDCGTSAHEAIAAAEGADVIVIDHHAGEETLPEAFAIINPNRQDESSELVYLCAAGVVFMFLVAVNRKFREQRSDLCNLMGILDLVALATVADVSPLIKLNRAFVSKGLKVMRRRNRPGIQALSDISKLNAPPNSYHLGFVLGPRINAGGRIGESNLGTRLLATNDIFEAEYLAEQLNALNVERRDMVDQATSEALDMVSKRSPDSPLVWAASPNWHPGIAGIVCSRLTEAIRLPAVVIAVGDKISKGSARSIRGINIGAAMMRCQKEGLLISGGGHAMAAGLTVNTRKIETFIDRLSEIIGTKGIYSQSTPKLHIDGIIQPRAITVPLIDLLESAGPYGQGSPAPRYVLPNLQVTFQRWVGSGHLQLRLRGNSGDNISAIAFRAGQSPIGKFLEQRGSQPVHIAGKLTADHYAGNITVKVQVEDAAPS